MSAAGAVELRLGAKELQRALRALVVADAGLRAQLLQAVAAVFGQTHHAALVHFVARGRAVAQHRDAPAHQVEVDVGADHQRAVLHQQPLDRLDRHAWAGPRRRVAGRDFAGVAVAGFERRGRSGGRPRSRRGPASASWYAEATPITPLPRTSTFICELRAPRRPGAQCRGRQQHDPRHAAGRCAVQRLFTASSIAPNTACTGRVSGNT